MLTARPRIGQRGKLRRSALTQPISNAGFAQVVWRHFQSDAVSHGQPHEVLPHLAGQMGENLVLVVQSHAKHRAGQHRGDRPFDLNWFFDTQDVPRAFGKVCLGQAGWDKSGGAGSPDFRPGWIQPTNTETASDRRRGDRRSRRARRHHRHRHRRRSALRAAGLH